MENPAGRKVLEAVKHWLGKESTAQWALYILPGTKCKLLYTHHHLPRKVDICSIALFNCCVINRHKMFLNKNHAGRVGEKSAETSEPTYNTVHFYNPISLWACCYFAREYFTCTLSAYDSTQSMIVLRVKLVWLTRSSPSPTSIIRTSIIRTPLLSERFVLVYA